MNENSSYRPPRPSEDAAHLLIIDDDRRIRDLLRRFLGENGYRVSAAADVGEARRMLTSIEFDALIIDVMMSGESGLSFVESLRKTSQVPILMLTALAEASDRISGLETGVDDYLTKPFEPRELLLRLLNILRRTTDDNSESAEVSQVTFGPYVYSTQSQTMTCDGQPLKLTDRERQILSTLSSKAGATISRRHLIGDQTGGERAIDVHINRLRRKIEKDPTNPLYLQTVRGIGYRLVIDNAR